MSYKLKTGGLQRQASFVPDTFNAEARTVDVCFGSDAPILMGYWERYYEILSFREGEIKMERLNAGAPLLDNHNRYSGAAKQPGVVMKAWVKDGKGYATVRFSKGKDGQELMDNVGDGIVTRCSIGYNVMAYEEVESAGKESQGAAKENKIPTYRATDWEPFEISFVSIPADITAGTRSMSQGELDKIESYEVEVINHSLNTNNDAMLKRSLFRDAGGSGEGNGGNAAPTTAAPSTGGQPTGGEQRSAAEPAPAPSANDGEAHQRGIAAEKARVTAIRTSCRAAKLSQAFEDNLIDTNVTADKARELIIAEFAKGEEEQPMTTSSNRNANANNEAKEASMRMAMSTAISLRANPEFKPYNPATATAEERAAGDAAITGAREFRGMTMLDMAKENLTQRGISLRGLYPMDIAQMALNIHERSGYMSTSDFPLILGNTINRTLRAQYALMERTFLPIVRQTTAKDFKLKTQVNLQDLGKFDEVKEGGEYKRTAMSEGVESYKLAKYGEIIPFTWEMLINDDLDAFGRLPQFIANAAADKQSDLVWNHFLGNPTMGDGVALFHASHSNIISSGTTISIDSFGAMRKLMRYQKDPAGRYMNVVPKYLVVGPNLEQLALQYTANDFTPTSNTGQNPWKGLIKGIIVEPRITGNDWYFVAQPGIIDTIETAFLEGEGELFTQTRTGFEVDGIETKARMVFGCKAMDYRGFVRNTGA